MSPRERLVFHVQELERLDELRRLAAEQLRDGFTKAKAEGYDVSTLKVVLKLRRMTSYQRSERRALEALYLCELGMLEGEPLPDEARRRLDESSDASEKTDADPSPDQPTESSEREEEAPGAEPPLPPQAQLTLKTPEEAMQEGADAAEAGKRVYDNPYPAGDLCRAAWDEGWCAHRKSNGMDTPTAYQRRSTKKDDSEKPGKDEKPAGGDEQHQGAA